MTITKADKEEAEAEAEAVVEVEEEETSDKAEARESKVLIREDNIEAEEEVEDLETIEAVIGINKSMEIETKRESIKTRRLEDYRKIKRLQR